MGFSRGPASFPASPRAEGREGQASKEHPGCSLPLLFLCSNSSPTHPVEALPVGSDVSECGGRWLPAPVGESEHPLKACALCPQHLLPSASMQDAQQWLHRNRFSQFCRLFASFSGEHLWTARRTYRGLGTLSMGPGCPAAVVCPGTHRRVVAHVCWHWAQGLMGGPALGVSACSGLEGRTIWEPFQAAPCRWGRLRVSWRGPLAKKARGYSASLLASSP